MYVYNKPHNKQNLDFDLPHDFVMAYSRGNITLNIELPNAVSAESLGKV